MFYYSKWVSIAQETVLKASNFQLSFKSVLNFFVSIYQLKYILIL